MHLFLIGPVTILNLSFIRIDTSRETQAMHIVLAIREDIVDLEKVLSGHFVFVSSYFL